MGLLETGRITIFDINGIPRLVQEVSVNNFLVLKELYTVYWDLVLATDPFFESSFFELIEADIRIKNTALEIVKLVGLKQKWLGIDTLAALVHSFIDTEGKPQKGQLWTHYFEKAVSKKSGDSLSLEEYRMFLIAAISESEGGIVKALEVCEKLSIEELEQYFTQKKRLNEKVNKPNQNKFKELKDEYKRKFGDTQFQGVDPKQWTNKS